MKYINILKENKWLALILILATFLRFYHLGFQEPWLDELSTLQVTDPELSFDKTHELIMTREGFPHFYFLCLKFISSIFGHSIYVLRMFSMVFGVASVYLVYLFINELIDKKTGYVAALLLTVNFFHIYHSQEARAYSLLLFFGLLACFRMIKYMKNKSFFNAILLGISCGLIPNAHPIGVLNVLVIYFTLLIFFIIENEKLKIFKQLSVSIIFTLIIFSPVYQIISRVSEIKSFWIPPANIDNIKQAFIELTGSSLIIFYVYITSVIMFLIYITYKIISTKNKEENKINIIFLSMVFFWIVINIGVIIIKSYSGISIILNRYFIGSIGLFLFTLSFCISLVKNNYIRISIISSFVLISLYFLIFQKRYYTEITKSEWQSLSNQIIANNMNKDKIYSAYGFVSNILFKHTPCYSLLNEIKFEDYLFSLKNNARKIESFWYFDGNFRPYSLSADDQLFIEKHYNLDMKIEKYDCWARHYVLKTSHSNDYIETNQLSLSDFNPTILDSQGSLVMFQNSTISSKTLLLNEGKYELIIEANSLPEMPIENQNAHLIIKINDKLVSQSFLSEKKENKKNVYSFVNADKLPKLITITFDNDLSKDDLDRNIIIYSINLKKL